MGSSVALRSMARAGSSLSIMNCCGGYASASTFAGGSVVGVDRFLLQPGRRLESRWSRRRLGYSTGLDCRGARSAFMGAHLESILYRRAPGGCSSPITPSVCLSASVFFLLYPFLCSLLYLSFSSYLTCLFLHHPLLLVFSHIFIYFILSFIYLCLSLSLIFFSVFLFLHCLISFFCFQDYVPIYLYIYHPYLLFFIYLLSFS